MSDNAISAISTIAQVVSAGAIVFAVRQIQINRNQLYSNTIIRCLDSFQEIDITQETDDEKQIRRYIDLIGEELFYIQKGFIPKEVALEWIDGMIEFIPLTHGNKEILNQHNCIFHLFKNRAKLLQSYPRIKTAFRVTPWYNEEIVYGEHGNERGKLRARITTEIFDNIRHFRF